MYFTFSWPQLVTAIVGGAIALVVIKHLNGTKLLRPNNILVHNMVAKLLMMNVYVLSKLVIAYYILDFNRIR